MLHSRIHAVWADAQGTQVRDRESGFRYTPTTYFETFPHPTKAQEAAIDGAAKELDALRNNWLNPPEWTKTETLEFSGSVDGPCKRYIDPATVVLGSRQRKQGAKSLAYAAVDRPSPKRERGAESLAHASGSEGNAGGIGTVRYPRLVAKDAVAAEKLKKRTLTNLYNEMPTWLKNVHAKLDEAVFAAYGWDAGISDDDLLAKPLALNLKWAK